MVKIHKLYFFLFLLLLSGKAYSQGELDDQPKVMLKNEKTGMIFLTSNGIGAQYRFGKRIDARHQTLYDIDFMNVKDPKELRLTSNYNYYTSRSFVFGKENNFFELKGSIGKQYELFRKNDKGGISIRYYYAAGPSIGILKPIYYEIRYIGQNYDYYKTEKFNTSIHQSNINGRASFFKGINEISLVPGASVKAGFSFEYSREDALLHAIDAGISVDLFPKPIPIMATEKNNFLFLNLTVGYRFGKIVDVSEAALAKNNKAKRQEKRLNRSISKDQKAKENQLENF
ncbi:MAG: hypothetical protein H6540_05005 [Bacteroidales bacterium]|nr:hypothetical protein [Bacteroidales bacterium]